MAKLILLSIIIFSTALPIALAEAKAPRKTLRNIQVATVCSVVVWAYLALTFYPALVPLD